MRKLYVLLGTLCACMLVGCSEDPNEEYISKTIGTLKDYTGIVESVTKSLNDAVAQAKKDKGKVESKEIDAAMTVKIDQAKEEAAKLKPNAKFLQEIKARTDSAKEKVTPEQLEGYAAKYKEPLQKAMEAAYKAQIDLETALNEANAEAGDAGKKALDQLRKELKDGQEQYEVLTKRQS